MSLRPEIYGFDQKRMFSLFGSKDQKAVADMTAALKKALSDTDDKEQRGFMDSAIKQIQSAVFEGVPTANLVSETVPQIWAAKLLAEHQQEMVDTESNFWKMRGIFDFVDEFEKRFEPQTKTLISYLINGRPLFGKDIQTDWNYYAYMNLDDVKVLRSGIDKQLKWAIDLTDKGYLNEIDFSGWTIELMEEMIGWFDLLIEKKRDLWFWAN